MSTVLLVALALVAAVVAVVAVRVRPASPSGSPSIPPVQTSSPTPGASGGAQTSAPPTSASPAGGEQTSAATGAALVQPPLTLLSPKVAWRASQGTCLTPSAVARSTDGGATWAEAAAPAVGVAQLQSRPPSAVAVIGETRACAARAWVSRADGGWGSPQPPTDAWFASADRPGVVQSPSGPVPNPCSDTSRPPVTVQTVASGQGALLCDDGWIYTGDGGSLTRLTRLDDSVALSFLDTRRAWALITDPSTCAGYAVFQSTDGGSSWVRSGCVGRAADRAGGQVPGLAWADPRHGMVVTGDATYTSSDGGRTWAAPSR